MVIVLFLQITGMVGRQPGKTGIDTVQHLPLARTA
jgi:hypothetical protein